MRSKIDVMEREQKKLEFESCCLLLVFTVLLLLLLLFLHCTPK
jgi:hypothetical protein